MDAFFTRLKGVAAILIVLAIALVPAWFYLAIRTFAEPDGFWQELALGVVAVWVLGSIQFVFLILGVIVAFYIWSVVEDEISR